MAGTELSKLSAETTAEICARFKLGDESLALLASGELDPELLPGEFLDQLLALGQHNDAVRFLAYALPRPEAVWWACRCLRSVAPRPDELPGVEAAEKWLRDPTDENRRAAMAVAESVEFSTPDAWAGVGVFWADGSMAPPDAPEVPPGEELTGHAIAGAVCLAAVQSEPQKAAEKQAHFAALAVEVANGRDTWQEPGSADAGA